MSDPVYAVFEVIVDDAAGTDAVAEYDRYRTAVPALVERFGGRYLARAVRGRALEGAPTQGRWHLVEFPSVADADAFWSSPEYVALKPLRDGAASVRAVLLAP